MDTCFYGVAFVLSSMGLEKVSFGFRRHLKIELLLQPLTPESLVNRLH